MKRIIKEKNKAKHFLGERKKKTVGITINLKKHVRLNHDVIDKLGNSVLSNVTLCELRCKKSNFLANLEFYLG